MAARSRRWSDGVALPREAVAILDVWFESAVRLTEAGEHGRDQILVRCSGRRHDFGTAGALDITPGGDFLGLQDIGCVTEGDQLVHEHRRTSSSSMIRCRKDAIAVAGFLAGYAAAPGGVTPPNCASLGMVP